VLNNIGGALPYPADPTGLLYLFYQPSPCNTAGGYHSTVTFNGSPVAYAVATTAATACRPRASQATRSPRR